MEMHRDIIYSQIFIGVGCTISGMGKVKKSIQNIVVSNSFS